VAIARPTILQIIPQLDTGGAELSAVEIAGAIVRAGGRALVATEGGRLAERVTQAGGEIIAFPAATKNPLRMLANTNALARLAQDQHVDLLHARSRAPAWSALGAARRAKLPFVTTYHGAYNERGRLKNLYNSVMARSDVVIANSGYTANLIRTRYGTEEKRIRVIHRGVDSSEFDPAAISGQRVGALRERWGIAPGQRVVLNPARLTSWKGQSVLIEAAGLLAARGVLGDAIIVLAGDAQGRNDYLAGLKERIAALGLGKRVRLVGHVDDMAAAYSLAYVAVIASTEPEAFGRVAIEAQAVGLPVIATDLGAPPETISSAHSVGSDRATGWLVPPNDAVKLADRLADAFAMTPDTRAQIGARARAHVLANFTLDAMKVRTLEVYDELLGTTLASAFRSAGADATRSGQR
jgi:glycosyltransferase involved in cell wall biosynthesis